MSRTPAGPARRRARKPAERRRVGGGTWLAPLASVRIVVVALLGLSQFAGVCSTPAPPPPDDCSQPGGESVASLSLGPERLPERPFEAWNPDDTAYVTQGSQGGNMVGISLGLAGDQLPACLAQRTEVRQGDDVIAGADVAINTYDEAGDGTRATTTLWLVFDDDEVPELGSEIDVVTEAGGRTATAHLTVVEDRHRLVSLTPPAPTMPWQPNLAFALESVHAPPDSSFSVQLAAEGDLFVLEPLNPAEWVYSDRTDLYIPSRHSGTAELIVRFREQEIRAPITLE